MCNPSAFDEEGIPHTDPTALTAEELLGLSAKAISRDDARIMRLDHIAIAAEDARVPLSFYCQLLGLRANPPQVVPDEGVIVTLVDVPGSQIEILEPTTDSSPVAKFIRERGGGLHHFCFEVVGLPKLLTRLKEAGVELVDEEPRPGRRGEQIAFIHPRYAHHVLVELAEPPPPDNAAGPCHPSGHAQEP